MREGGEGRRAGAFWDFLTGILGVTGTALLSFAFGRRQGSIVSAATALFPLVTVILAVTFLNERMGTPVLVPDVTAGQTVPGAAARYSGWRQTNPTSLSFSIEALPTAARQGENSWNQGLRLIFCCPTAQS